MTGIYLSGTGNTKHCMEKLCQLLDENCVCIPIEQKDAVEQIKKEEMIVLGYPTQFSNAPIMVRDFIKDHAELWKGKKVFILVTMGAFSGDGAGCSARLFRKYGAKIVGGLHLKMPDSVCDSKLLKKSLEENQNIIREADLKIEQAVKDMKDGKYPQSGLRIWNHLAGLFGQRLWFYGKTLHYAKNLQVHDTCIGCGLCVKQCPMHNLVMKDGRPVQKNQCTMCYRCISSCPQRAITLLGKEVQEQCRYERYQVK